MKINKWLISCLLLTSQAMAQQASIFQYGFARVADNNKTWYIDRKGAKAFDEIIGYWHPVSVTAEGNLQVDEKEQMLLVRQNGKTGAVTNEGEWLLPPVYDTISLEWKVYLSLYKDGKMTYADTHGKLLLPMVFDSVGILDVLHFDVKEKGKWGVYGVAEKQLVIPAVYDAIDYCGGCGSKSDYVFAEKNGKWGVLNLKNEILAPFEYEHNHYMMRSDNWVLCFKKNRQEVALNLDNKKEYAAPEYTQMDVIGNGLLKAEKNGHYGLIGPKGDVVADFNYDDIASPYPEWTNGPYIRLTKNKKSGIIGENGQVVLPLIYDGDIICYGNYFVVPVNGNYNLLDTTGKKLLAVNYNEITDFENPSREQLFKLKQKAIYGFYNPSLRKLVPPAFFEIDDAPWQGCLTVSYQEKKGVYSADGRMLIPMAYKSLNALTSRWWTVEKATGVGIWDVTQQRELIPATFYNVDLLPGDSTLLLATKRDLYVKGLYNGKGQLVLPLRYSGIMEAGNNLYLLASDANNKRSYTIFNSRTLQQTPLAYDDVMVTGQQDILIVTKGNKKGLMHATGQVILPPTYEDIIYLKNKVFNLQTVGEDQTVAFGYADSTGKIIVPPVYAYYGGGYPGVEDSLYLPITQRGKEDGQMKFGLVDFQGTVVLPAIYDRILREENGRGFLVEVNHQFTVLNAHAQPVTTQTFDDVMIDPTTPYTATVISYEGPLLCRKGDTYRYLLADGTFLPLTAKEVIPFEADPAYGIPAL
ncbi:hypothetical protein HGH93_07115 [Chitinophaga polysaccharea]|uniref:WG repeat-containing protein n=1 Tax=Chitinophaga polysaccharea TaxID=1293035 RepID=UPI001454F764|nr:WG repeat-containing protein [Chitinophaga polysaccharea]NLR57863.1 hypothetical protein [Chitinophaga polysaccharea]